MTPKLKILSNVIERLQKFKCPGTGYLYGIMDDNNLTVLTFTLNILDEEQDIPSHSTLQLNMPIEVDLCGVLHIGKTENEIPDAFKDIDVTDNPLLLKYFLNGSNIESYFYVHQKLEAVHDVEILDENKIFQQFTYIRLQGRIPLIVENSNITEALQELKKTIASGKVGIHFPVANHYLFSSDENFDDISLKELVPSLVHKGYNNMKNSSNSSGSLLDVVDANMFLKVSGYKFPEDSKTYAPVLQHIKRVFNSFQFSLKIDALSLVNQNVNSARLYDILIESVCRNVKAIEQSLEEQSVDISSMKGLPEIFHFKPEGCGHSLTLIFPSEVNDAELVEYRKTFHRALALDMTRPYFRRGNAIIFKNDVKPGDPLINPHESISYLKDSENITVTVKGLYSYYHYMQGGISDDGWGCAYRSLQTIVSWYRFQGFTDVEVPSHKAIQKCLVDIGDKPHSFIGSRQWIGSTEVGFVLETLLGVNVKILCASNGEEVSTFAQNLIDHFQSQGTPIMIGGGVLAHTILGVNYDENSGDVKFLILDPHYTGPEDINTIVNKGWCGWKAKDFWKKDAFYNMCLPQRLVAI